MKPEPKTVKVVCTVCGLDWDKHTQTRRADVPLDECVRLLKLELAAARATHWPINTTGGNYSFYPVTSSGI